MGSILTHIQVQIVVAMQKRTNTSKGIKSGIFISYMNKYLGDTWKLLLHYVCASIEM